MAALTTERLSPQLAGSSGPIPAKNTQPVAAATKIFAGSMVALSATGFARPGQAAVGTWCIGKAEFTVDNTSGVAGDLNVTALTGCFRFENSASTDLIAQANVGQLAYLVDDQTVALTSAANTRSVAGRIFKIDAQGVWVIVGVDNLTGLQVAAVRQAEYRKDAVDGAAANVTSERVIERIVNAGLVVGAFFCPDAALTADNTNNASLLLGVRNGAGGSLLNIATLATTIANGNWTAFVPISLGTLANTTLAAGNILTFSISKGGTGVVVPAGQIVVLYAPA